MTLDALNDVQAGDSRFEETANGMIDAPADDDHGNESKKSFMYKKSLREKALQNKRSPGKGRLFIKTIPHIEDIELKVEITLFHQNNKFDYYHWLWRGKTSGPK